MLKDLKDLWNLEDNQMVLVNSEEVGLDHILKEGDVVEFVKKSSQKG
ncbi:MAG: TGS domain-containing protein [bacterium]|nr:TGS domain-containing protein [bacterium]